MEKDSVVGGCTSHGSPRGVVGQRWLRSVVQKPLLGSQVQLSARLLAQSRVPMTLQDYVGSRSPETWCLHKPERFQEQMRRQSLSTGSAAGKDLTEIQLELHQVSALSPQLQARRSFPLSCSLLQVAIFNTRRGLTNGGQGQQDQSPPPFWGLLSCFFSSPFPSFLIFPL